MSVAFAEDSARELQLEDQFKRLPKVEENRIYYEALAHFTNCKGEPTWWWEYFREELPHTSKCWRDGVAFERITKIVPDPNESVWCIVEENRTPYPVYLSSPSVIQKVVGNSCGFEYYILNRDFKWLLCENHHEVLIAVGEPVASNLAHLKDDLEETE